MSSSFITSSIVLYRDRHKKDQMRIPSAPTGTQTQVEVVGDEKSLDVKKDKLNQLMEIILE